MRRLWEVRLVARADRDSVYAERHERVAAAYLFAPDGAAAVARCRERMARDGVPLLAVRAVRSLRLGDWDRYVAHAWPAWREELPSRAQLGTLPGRRGIWLTPWMQRAPRPA